MVKRRKCGRIPYFRVGRPSPFAAQNRFLRLCPERPALDLLPLFLNTMVKYGGAAEPARNAPAKPRTLRDSMAKGGRAIHMPGRLILWHFPALRVRFRGERGGTGIKNDTGTGEAAVPVSFSFLPFPCAGETARPVCVLTGSVPFRSSECAFRSTDRSRRHSYCLPRHSA